MHVQGKRADLREMYAEWPFFQSTIDLIEMILAKADMRIAELYDATLVTDPAHRRLGAHLRQHFQSTVDAVLQASCLLSTLIERFRLVLQEQLVQNARTEDEHPCLCGAIGSLL